MQSPITDFDKLADEVKLRHRNPGLLGFQSRKGLEDQWMSQTTKQVKRIVVLEEETLQSGRVIGNYVMYSFDDSGNFF